MELLGQAFNNFKKKCMLYKYGKRGEKIFKKTNIWDPIEAAKNATMLLEEKKITLFILTIEFKNKAFFLPHNGVFAHDIH